MNFRLRLKELREEMKLTQKELAKETGLSLSAIGKWEAGLREPSINAVVVLSQYFEISIESLLGLD